MVVRLGGRAGGMPRWSDMCPADSIDTAVLVPKKFRGGEKIQHVGEEGDVRR